jgi:hypothetical protein
MEQTRNVVVDNSTMIMIVILIIIIVGCTTLIACISRAKKVEQRSLPDMLDGVNPEVNREVRLYMIFQMLNKTFTSSTFEQAKI